MEASQPYASSRSSLVVERHYVPRSAPRPSARTSTFSDSSQPNGTYVPDQPSPGMSSVNSHSPNGYIADNSISEVSGTCFIRIYDPPPLWKAHL